MRRTAILAGVLALLLVPSPARAQGKPADETVACRDYRDTLALFDRLGYTRQAWQSGIREVPRVYLEDMAVIHLVPADQ